jgi:hypothetical protein
MTVPLHPPPPPPLSSLITKHPEHGFNLLPFLEVNPPKTVTLVLSSESRPVGLASPVVMHRLMDTLISILMPRY